MKVISVKQPWAHFIIHGNDGQVFDELPIGKKDIENRSWPVPSSITFPRWIGIHASKSHDKEFCTKKKCQEIGCEFGAIIGIVIVHSSVEESLSLWFNGPHGWTLSHAKALKEVIPAKGQLNFWDHDLPMPGSDKYMDG